MSGSAPAGSNQPFVLNMDPGALQASTDSSRPLWPGGPSADSLGGIDLSRPGIRVIPIGDSTQVNPFLLGGVALPAFNPQDAFSPPVTSADPTLDHTSMTCVDPNADSQNHCEGPPLATSAPQPAAAATPAPPRVDPARQRFQSGVMRSGETANFDRQTRCIAHGSPLENELIRAFGLNPEQPDAVQILQRAVGANPDGKIGPQTVNAIARYFRQHAAEVSITNPEQLVVFERMVQFINQAAMQPIPRAISDQVHTAAVASFDAEAQGRYAQALADAMFNPAGPRHVAAPQAAAPPVATPQS